MSVYRVGVCDAYMMRKTRPIENYTLGELLAKVQKLVEKHGKNASFEPIIVDGYEGAHEVCFRIERPATESEIMQFKEQELARLKQIVDFAKKSDTNLVTAGDLIESISDEELFG